MALKINEIFSSIQGESTYAGLPCAFVRLAGCNLRCRYCDSEFAYEEGAFMEVEEIVGIVDAFGLRTVEITGGEPLLQDEVHGLISVLLGRDYRVLLETNGSLDLSSVDPRVVKIVDVKCPESGMAGHMRWENLATIRSEDELKFVLCSRSDYEWAKARVREHGLSGRCNLLFSPAFGVLPAEELASWILEDRLDVRLQLQLHKIIWGPNRRGV